MAMYCPYCDTEINETLIEQEDGCCPECGAFISASMVINDDEDYEDEYGDDDILGDEDGLGDLDLDSLDDEGNDNDEF